VLEGVAVAARCAATAVREGSFYKDFTIGGHAGAPV
jgi:hypothetical protein